MLPIRHLFPASGRRTGCKRGQVLVIVALMFTVLVGFAGLALDAGHLFLVFRNAQNATDTAALAAGKQLTGGMKTSPPAGSNDPAVVAAHDLAAANGFGTVRNLACDSVTPTSFTTNWYDAGACGNTTYNVRVSIYSPPQTLTADCQAVPYNCLQVVITQRVQNYLMGAMGIPTSTITTSATAFAEPSGNVLQSPAPVALYLYQPQTGCSGLGTQCFNEAAAPARGQLSCQAGANCPTLWITTGAGGVIAGINGSLGTGDFPAVESNGDILIQDPTTICDPYGGATCSSGSATGLKGFALGAGSKLYCSGSTPTPLVPAACTTAGPGGAALSTVAGNETGFTAYPWTGQVDTTALTYCGHLLLNGDKVTAGNVLPAACTPPTDVPFTIMPGKYDYIVINHGSYEFESGIYDILGSAPVNTSAVGPANGIDHGQERSNDWDLCTGAAGNPTACPSLTAGVWIGYGQLPATAPFTSSTTGSCDGTGPSPLQGGGGDKTDITGTGVVFKFEPGAGGFVSTFEVDFIALTSPAAGAMRQTAGVPILFDLENNGFIHLDASGGNLQNFFSQYKGIIYQTPSAKAGGVEVDPHLGHGNVAAISGQVYAYSFASFGTSGGDGILNFAEGEGAATSPIVTTSGDNEQEILTSASLVDPGIPGWERVVVDYSDEWKLDAYDVYVKINNNAPIFFSAGIWNPAPSGGAPLPPANNNPGDMHPASPASIQDPANNYTKALTLKPDWKITYGPAFPYGPGDSSTFEISGDWVWGHEQDITGAVDGSDAATLTYTFPIPSGPAVNVTIFMSDGDSCGDFAIATFTFNNLGGGSPSPGQQTVGTVHLVQ